MAERVIVLTPMLQQREHIMTPAEIEGRRVIALRLFDALCAQYPDKYIYLIQPCDLAEDPVDQPTTEPRVVPPWQGTH